MNPDDAMKRISQLEEALMLMVYQYCVTDDRQTRICSSVW